MVHDSPPRPRQGPPASSVGLVLLALVLQATVPAASSAEPAWEDPETEAVLTGLDGPVDVALAEDGSVWWNEYYSGNVTRWDPSNGTREVVFHADPVPDGVERGLVGLALDPNVTENGVFYVYYTVAGEDPDGGTNRLSRVDGGEETVLLTVPAFKRHNGGRILFVPDGTMFVSTGDNEEGHPAQDPSSRLGKILHLTPEGEPANDTIEGYVYSIGHRNVYGLAYDPATDRLFATENNNAERDEINLIEAGNNYGWPHCAGTVAYDPEADRARDDPCTDERFQAPIAELYPNGTVAPTGAAVVDSTLYWASWNHGEIHALTPDPNGEGWTDRLVFDQPRRINDLEASPDGEALYYANWTSIVRVELPSQPVPAPNASADSDRGSPASNGSRPSPDATVPLPAVGLQVAVALLAAAGLGVPRPPGEG